MVDKNTNHPDHNERLDTEHHDALSLHEHQKNKEKKTALQWFLGELQQLKQSLSRGFQEEKQEFQQLIEKLNINKIVYEQQMLHELGDELNVLKYTTQHNPINDKTTNTLQKVQSLLPQPIRDQIATMGVQGQQWREESYGKVQNLIDDGGAFIRYLAS